MSVWLWFVFWRIRQVAPQDVIIAIMVCLATTALITLPVITSRSPHHLSPGRYQLTTRTGSAFRYAHPGRL